MCYDSLTCYEVLRTSQLLRKFVCYGNSYLTVDWKVETLFIIPGDLRLG